MGAKASRSDVASTPRPNILFATHCQAKAVDQLISMLELADERSFEELCPGVRVQTFAGSAPLTHEPYNGTAFAISDLRNVVWARDETRAALRKLARNADAIVYVYDVDDWERGAEPHSDMPATVALLRLLEWIRDAGPTEDALPRPPPLLALAISPSGNMTSLEGAAASIGLSSEDMLEGRQDGPEDAARREILEGTGTLFCDWRYVGVGSFEPQDALCAGFGWVLAR